MKRVTCKACGIAILALQWSKAKRAYVTKPRPGCTWQYCQNDRPTGVAGHTAL